LYKDSTQYYYLTFEIFLFFSLTIFSLDSTNLVIVDAAVQINYLTKQKNDKLRLIEGDDDTFAEVLQLLDEYEGEVFF